MSAFSRLPENRDGSAVDKFALFCAAAAVLCVVGAHAMDRLAQRAASPSPPPSHSQAYPGVDYSATGSISPRGGAPRLDPCGGGGAPR